MDFKGIIFDFDGTLGDSLFFLEWEYEQLSREFYGGKTIRLTPEEDKRFRTSLLSEITERLYETYGIGQSAEELLCYVNQSLRDFYQTKVKPKPGVVEFLEHCKARGIPMCIASATATTELELAVDVCGLRKYFPKIFSCAEVGIGKDQPDIFLLAQEWLGTKREETWLFDDSLVALQTARSIGMQTVGIFDVNNPYTEEQLRSASTIYLSAEQTMADLIAKS